MSLILSFCFLTAVLSAVSIQNNRQFFEKEATLEAKYDGIDYIFHLRLDPIAQETVYHVDSFEPRDSNMPQPRLPKTPRSITFPVLKPATDKNGKVVGYINTGKFYNAGTNPYLTLEDKKNDGEFHEKGIFKAKGFEVDIETKFYLHASAEWGILNVKYEGADYKLHIKRDSATSTEPKFHVHHFEPHLYALKRNPHKIPEIVYFPIEEMVNNTYIFGDEFYEPEIKEKTCEFYKNGLYTKEENEVGVETKVYIYGSEWGILSFKYEGEDYDIRIKRDHSTPEESKFRVDYYDYYSWTSKLYKIPETVYFPKEIINTHGEKFYEREKKWESCEFYERGLYSEADNGVGVETEFYLAVKTMLPAIVEPTADIRQLKKGKEIFKSTKSLIANKKEELLQSNKSLFAKPTPQKDTDRPTLKGHRSTKSLFANYKEELLQSNKSLFGKNKSQKDTDQPTIKGHRPTKSLVANKNYGLFQSNKSIFAKTTPQNDNEQPKNTEGLFQSNEPPFTNNTPEKGTDQPNKKGKIFQSTKSFLSKITQQKESDQPSKKGKLLQSTKSFFSKDQKDKNKKKP